jgi:hypothetical protein
VYHIDDSLPLCLWIRQFRRLPGREWQQQQKQLGRPLYHDMFHDIFPCVTMNRNAAAPAALPHEFPMNKSSFFSEHGG